MAAPKRFGILALVLALAALLVQIQTHEVSAGGEAKPAEATKMAACPISLTNPDGQALTLEKYDLKVAVHGPLSMTEMEMTFRNPEARQMEGRFLYLLPGGATVSRFAKEVNGHLMEGEVVETQRARAVYREILHSMRDPALMEFDQGDRFAVKVFPIPANGTVRLVLSFSQLLPIKDGKRHLTIPMAGLPKIKDFSFNAYVQGWPGEKPSMSAGFNEFETKEAGFYSTGCKAENYLAQNDIELTITPDLKELSGKTRALKAGNVQMISYMPKMPIKAIEMQDPAALSWNIFVDTSASNLDMEARRLQALEYVLNAMTWRGPVDKELPNSAVTAFDVEVASIFKGDNVQIREQTIRALKNRHALGATDLGLALRTIGEAARNNPKAKYVLVSDGIATWGAREIRDVVGQLGAWPTDAVMNVLVLGNKQDSRMLDAIVEKTNGRVVQYAFNGKFDEEAQKAVRELMLPPGQTFEFYDESAEWIFPKKFKDVRAGQELLAFSSMKNGMDSKPGVTHLADRIDTETPKYIEDVLQPELLQTTLFEPLLKRESGSAYIRELERQEQNVADTKKIPELRKQRVEASIKYRVLTPLTSLLVLETENDYARYGIDRKALAEVLAVGGNGIQIASRDPQAIAASPKPAVKKQDARKEMKKLADKAEKAGEAKEELSKAPSAAGTTSPAAKDEAEKDIQGEELAEAQEHDRGTLQAGLGGGRGRGEGGANDDAVAFGGRDGEQRRAALTRGPAGDAQNAFAAAPPGSPAPIAGATVADPNGAHPVPAPGERALRETNAGVAVDQLQQAQQQPAQANTITHTTGKAALPDWARNGGKAPSETELAALRAKVAADPMNLTLRNTGAEALKAAKQWDTLQAFVMEWLPFDPENPQAYEFLANSAAGIGDTGTAFRAATSIAEVSPKNAALLQRAGWIMMLTKKYDLAIALFNRSLEERKDDPNTYRGLALAQWLKKDFSGSLKTYEQALAQDFHNRYGDVKRVFKEEAGYVWRAYFEKSAKEGEASNEIGKIVQHLKIENLKADALRVSLGWETDANDVDLHVIDPNGEDCFYSHKNNASGLELYSDQTQGLGPEVIRTDKVLKGEYHIGVTYFNAGPMGVSRGVVVVLQPNEKGIVEAPAILPFCLLPDGGGGKDIRHVLTVSY